MREPVKTSVIYYSSTGNVHALATALAEGAEKAGSEVRLRKVAELAPPQAIAGNPKWAEHVENTRDVAEASLDDLLWADAVLLGTPTRYGAMASQLKQFIDITGPVWQQGLLADKVYGAFGSAGTRHGGHESTLLSLHTIFYHWGGIIVPPGYTHSVQFQVGTPYGTTHLDSDGEPGELALESGRYQARRAVETAAKLKAARVPS
ncbi:NAD(P)H:quinone oxidoreductase [Nonomuraea mesophila]|uniref:NAD(P)H:quinone oxidoreductase n=1 Tax=Nonomuraea mesophila TaxID=2530382 RepID=A0A4R5F8T4_9ACTN|nr:NAD(P)H:quinone oxidoreductase [Nonomuraea mesophila]TDE44534.1 NAD(P)H:quinone oxidoreductase [Nonomuraea mesophila]